MPCKGCGKHKKLIKAHVIPESFFLGLKSDGKVPLMVADAWRYTKRAPVGVYDKKILCHDCEQKFQDIDNYGQKILLKDTIEAVKRDGIVVYYKIPEVNYNLTKLFFMSVLWRASISSHVFYSKINLGKFENIIKEYIWDRNPGTPEEFSFFLARFTDEEFGTAMLNPRSLRFDSVNYYIFYLYGYILYIKVDKRPTPENFNQLILKTDQDLFVIGRDIAKSKELKAMYEVVNN